MTRHITNFNARQSPSDQAVRIPRFEFTMPGDMPVSVSAEVVAVRDAKVRWTLLTLRLREQGEGLYGAAKYGVLQTFDPELRIYFVQHAGLIAALDEVEPKAVRR